MRATWRWTAALLLALSACGGSCDGSDQARLGKDPRLGLVVWQKEGQGPKQARPGADRFLGLELYLGGLVPLKSGVNHVLLAYRPWREIDSPDEHWAVAEHLAVAADGTVTSLAPPPVSYPLWEDARSLRTFDTDQPALLLQGHKGGEAFRVLAFDGAAWTTLPFFWSDRPSGSVAPTLDAAHGQLDLFSAASALLQFDDRVLSFKDGKWTRVETPKDAVEVRLGPVSAAAVRLLWTARDGLVHTQLLDRATLALTGPEAVSTSPVAHLGAHFGWAGTVDDATFDADQVTMELGRGRLVVLGAGPTGTSRLVDVGTPGVGVRYSGDALGALTLVSRGASAGDLGALPATLTINCPTQCKRSDAGLLPEDCLQCSPRPAALQDWAVLPGAAGALVLIEDVKDDVTRLYLKRVGFPLGDIVNNATVPGAQGVDGGEGPIDRRVLGTVGRFDGTPLPGASVVLSLNQATLQAQTADAQGAFGFSVTEPGTYSVDVTFAGLRPGHADAVVDRDPVQVEVDLDGPVQSAEGIADGGVAQRLGLHVVQRSGAEVRIDGAVFSTTADPAEPVVYAPDTQFPEFGIANTDGVSISFAGSQQVAHLPTLAQVHHTSALRPYGSFVYPSRDLDGTDQTWLDINGTVQGTGADLAVIDSPDRLIDMRVFFLAAGGAQVGTLTLPPSSVPRLRAVEQVTHQPGVAKPALLGFDGAACGREGGYVAPCPLWYVEGSGPPPALNVGKLSTQATAAAAEGLDVFWVERQGSTGKVFRATFGSQDDLVGAQVGQFVLPAAYRPHEVPLLAAGSGQVLLQTATAVTQIYAGGDVVQVTGVVRTRGLGFGKENAPPQAIAVWSSPTGSCEGAQGCALTLLVPNQNPAFLLGSGARGNEVFTAKATGVIFEITGVLSEVPASPCAGTVCTAVQYTPLNGAAPQVLTYGTLWLDADNAWKIDGPGYFLDRHGFVLQMAP
jgi:hypothetical protein